ncbi:mitochondrial ribosomal protein L17 [Hymenopellis radicata]|nr:mitochondrial ribosomal protein L17 [Hymenopellis radicata]
MKHGMAFRKFSRTTSHRNLMLRNLVTSLLEHEQIQTTLPKARDAARLAEKMITLAKRGKAASVTAAGAFLLNQSLIPKLFGPLAQRYANRPGGYTRIHKFGNRPGDNAPNAILELVDNPRDLRWHITARSVGWELMKDQLKDKEPIELIGTACKTRTRWSVLSSRVRQRMRGSSTKTRWNLQKVLKYRGADAQRDFVQAAEQYADTVLASTVAAKACEDNREHKAGHMPVGETRNALHLAKGITGHQKPAPSEAHILSVKNMFKRLSTN